MSYIRKYQSFSNKKRSSEEQNASIVSESVMVVNDLYKVNATIDIPQSLINAYVKKVKDSLDKNARQFYSDQLMAEEIVKHILQHNLDIDKIDARALFGGVPQGQNQAQVQVQGTQQAPQAQTQAPQEQTQAPQAQAPAQAQEQAPAQAQGQAPAQNTQDFEEVEDEEKENEEELPL
jgi:hypothetical protein